MVQLPPFLVRGMLTMSNCTLRHKGCRSNAKATRALISSRVAGVLANSVSKSMSHPLRMAVLKPVFGRGPRDGGERPLEDDCWGEIVNGALRPEPEPVITDRREQTPAKARIG